MRRIIAVLLTMVLLLPTGLTAMDTKQATAASNKAEKVIKALDILEIDQGAITSATTKITRAQYAQLLVNMSSLKDAAVVTSNVTLFSDVPKKYWAAGYIKTAISKGWMSGYLDGSFKPNQGVTLLEAVNGVLKLLGYTDSDFTGNIVGNKMATYNSKKLNENITVTKKTAMINYNNCVNLFYNTLNATTKDGKVYAETLGYSLDKDGKLDYLSLVSTKTEGPFVADESWTSKIPFSLYTATCYKNDEKCSYSEINEYDVIYYSENFNTVWAYDNKVTGIITSINPDLLNPTSVTVAGVQYSFETSEASLAFSSLGNKEKGDIVTLLLGKSGTIAGVLDLDEYNTTITGVVLSVGTHMVENKDGIYKSMGYVTFVDASGNSYTHDYDTDYIDFEEEDIARVTYQDGVATISEYTMPAFTFSNSSVNSKGTYLGDYKLASNIKILDLYEGEYMSIYPIRLADVTISDTYVSYFELNPDGELSKLILKGVTGDLDSYGIFTGYNYSGNSGTYNYIIDGSAGKVTTSSFADFTSKEGPVGFRYSGSSIVGSYSLTGISVASIGSTTITAGNIKYSLAEKISVYYVNDDDEYTATTKEKVSNLSKYKVTAYYDKAITLGGKVRVLVAEAID